MVGGDLGILRRLTGDEAEPGHDVVVAAEGVPDEAPLPVLADDSGAAQVEEVAGDRGGRHVEDGCDLAHAEGSVTQDEENPEPRCAREGLHPIGENGERVVWHFGLLRNVAPGRRAVNGNSPAGRTAQLLRRGAAKHGLHIVVPKWDEEDPMRMEVLERVETIVLGLSGAMRSCQDGSRNVVVEFTVP